MITAIVFLIAAMGGVLIAWLYKRRKRKSAKPDASTQAGPGDTGPGTGTPR